MNDIILHYLIGFIFGISFFILAWVSSVVVGKSSLIDSVWGFSFFLITLLYYYLSGKILTILDYTFITVVFIWSVRLGIFLAIRFMSEGEDKRYVEIKKNWNKSTFGFIGMFALQGFLASLLSIPMLLISHTPITSSFLFYIGLALIVIFTILESLADYQLYTFKKKNKGVTCNVGLWAYSRHPNYFSEWMIWVGLFICCIPLGSIGVFSIFSVLIIYYLLNHVSGIPIIEKDAREGIYKRQGEEEYFKRTPAFFPALRRK